MKLKTYFLFFFIFNLLSSCDEDGSSANNNNNNEVTRVPVQEYSYYSVQDEIWFNSDENTLVKRVDAVAIDATGIIEGIHVYIFSSNPQVTLDATHKITNHKGEVSFRLSSSTMAMTEVKAWASNYYPFDQERSMRFTGFNPSILEVDFHPPLEVEIAQTLYGTSRGKFLLQNTSTLPPEHYAQEYPELILNFMDSDINLDPKRFTADEQGNYNLISATLTTQGEHEYTLQVAGIDGFIDNSLFLLGPEISGSMQFGSGIYTSEHMKIALLGAESSAEGLVATGVQAPTKITIDGDYTYYMSLPYSPNQELLTTHGSVESAWFIPVVYIDENDNDILDQNESLRGALFNSPSLYYERPAGVTDEFGEYWHMAEITDASPVFLPWETAYNMVNIYINRRYKEVSMATISTDATDFTDLRIAFFAINHEVDPGFYQPLSINTLTSSDSTLLVDMEVTGTQMNNAMLLSPFFFLSTTTLNTWAKDSVSWLGYPYSEYTIIPVQYKDENGNQEFDNGDTITGRPEHDFGISNKIIGARNISWEEILNHPSSAGLGIGLNYLQGPEIIEIAAISGDGTATAIESTNNLPELNTQYTFEIHRGEFHQNSPPIATGTLTIPTGGTTIDATCTSCNLAQPGDLLVITEFYSAFSSLNWSNPIRFRTEN